MREIMELGQQGNRSEAVRLYNNLSHAMKTRFKEYAKTHYNPDTYKDILFYFNISS